MSFTFSYEARPNPRQTKYNGARWPLGVANALEKQGLSVSEVAKASGLSTRRLHRFLAGKARLTDKQYGAVLKAASLSTVSEVLIKEVTNEQA